MYDETLVFNMIVVKEFKKRALRDFLHDFLTFRVGGEGEETGVKFRVVYFDLNWFKLKAGVIVSAFLFHL